MYSCIFTTNVHEYSYVEDNFRIWWEFSVKYLADMNPFSKAQCLVKIDHKTRDFPQHLIKLSFFLIQSIIVFSKVVYITLFLFNISDMGLLMCIKMSLYLQLWRRFIQNYRGRLIFHGHVHLKWTLIEIEGHVFFKLKTQRSSKINLKNKYKCYSTAIPC